MRILSATCLAVLMLLSAVAFGWTPVPLPNAGFEAWTDGVPDGWGLLDAITPKGCLTPSIIGPSDDAAGGDRSLQFAGETATCSWQGVMSSALPVRPGQVYRLEGSMRTVDVDTMPRRFANSQILLIAFDGKGKRLAYGGSRPMTGTHDWTRVEATLTVPEGAASIQAGAFLSIPGTARFDDFALSVLDVPAVDASASRAERWRTDLAYLDDLLTAVHPQPFAVLPREAFQAKLADLDAAAADLTDDEMFWRVRALTIALGDPHTGLGRDDGFGPRLPVNLAFFGDELRVVAVDDRQAELLGARITAIDGHPLEAVLAALREQIACTHENWFRAQTPGWCRMPEALHALGMADGAGALSYTGVTDDGREVTATVTLQAADGASSFVEAGPPEEDLPLHRRHDRSYWFCYLPETRTLYLKYDRAGDDPERPLRAFAQALVDTLDARPIDRFVVDLRDNTGGSNVMNGVWRELGQRQADGRVGRLFGITGRSTFSAAVYDAEYLRRHAGAVLVGEATGMAPVHPGEVRMFTLPGTGLTFACSSAIIRNSDDPSPAILPDVAAETSWADFLAGRDPALEAVLAYPLPDK